MLKTQYIWTRNPNIHEYIKYLLNVIHNTDDKGQTVNGSMRNGHSALSSSTGLSKHIEITLLWGKSHTDAQRHFSGVSIRHKHSTCEQSAWDRQAQDYKAVKCEFWWHERCKLKLKLCGIVSLGSFQTDFISIMYFRIFNENKM